MIKLTHLPLFIATFCLNTICFAQQKSNEKRLAEIPVQFTSTANSTCANSLTVTITDQTQTNEPITNWTWEIFNSDFSFSQAFFDVPSFTINLPPGVYTVYLSVATENDFGQHSIEGFITVGGPEIKSLRREGMMIIAETENNPNPLEWTLVGDPGFREYTYNDTLPITKTGTYYALADANGCLHEMDITISDAVQASFVAEVQNGCKNVEIDFTNNSEGMDLEFRWDFSPNTITYVNGSSETSSAPTVRFLDAGSYAVKLYASSGLSEDSTTYQDYIEIMDIDTSKELIINDPIDDTLRFCEDEEIDLYFNESDFNSLIDISWSTGESDEEITVDTEGTYTLSVTEENNCIYSDEILVEVEPAPAISIRYSQGYFIADFGSEVEEIEWLKDGNIIPNEDNDSLLIEGNGYYQAYAYSAIGCEGISNGFNITGIGLDEIKENTFTVFPNPSTGTIAFKSKLNFKEGLLYVSNLSGKTVSTISLNKLYQTVDLNLAPGIYFLTIEVDNVSIGHQKLMITK